MHALLGENGAGKSTLVKCMMGYYRPDDGDLLVWERERTLQNPRDAHALGMGMVYQHFTLVPNMTVAENLLMARPSLPAVISWTRERQGSKLFWPPCRSRLTWLRPRLYSGSRRETKSGVTEAALPGS